MNFNVSPLSFIIIVFLAFAFFAMLGFFPTSVQFNSRRAQSFNNLKNICIAMQDYASSDVERSRMPYPASKKPDGFYPEWGEAKDAWSPEVVKLLFKNHFLSKGNEGILVSTGVTGGEYEAMLLSEDSTADGNVDKMRWETDAELHFHVYCSSRLTNAASGNMVIGISYDQPDINNCLFRGEGWIVFMMDGSGGFKKRNLYGQYYFDSDKKNLLNNIANGVGLKKAKEFDPKASLRKVFGVNGNGGSTEIIGRKNDSAIYKTFVDE